MYLSLPSAITKYRRLGGLQMEIYFLRDSEARSSRSRCQKIWFLVQVLFLACKWLSSCHILT